MKGAESVTTVGGRGWRVVGATVDHGLQEGSDAQAARVVEQMAAIGVAETLTARVSVGLEDAEELERGIALAPDSPEVSQKAISMLMEGQPTRRNQVARALVVTEVPIEGGLNPLIESLRSDATPSPEILGAISLYGREAGGAVSRQIGRAHV